MAGSPLGKNPSYLLMKKEDGCVSYSQEKLSGKRPYGQTDCAKGGLSQIEEQDDERIIQSQEDVIVPTD